jgi:transcriptional regulator with GAF, ATPase, and Fis domain
MKDGTGDRGEAVLAIFQRGADFTRELLQENERLRGLVNSIELRQREAAQSPEGWDKLRYELISRIEDLEVENRDIMEQLRAVESENRQFADRYIEIEEENNNLANLYVASYQLHSTLDPSEVLRVIVEIVINLIGAEVFCVYVCEADSDMLEPVASEGANLDEFSEMRVGHGPVGEAVQSGTVLCSDGPPAEGASLTEAAPIVAIPLRVDDVVIGAIAVHRLLQQKSGFSALDHELFTLLAGHAATAIFASRLYAQSERKLSTIQGFIDLLTR